MKDRQNSKKKGWKEEEKGWHNLDSHSWTRIHYNEHQKYSNHKKKYF